MKDIALLTKGFQLGRISIDAYAFGLLEATRQSKSFKDPNDEIAKSLKENEDALNKNRQAVEDAMQALKDHIRGIDEEIGAIGLSKVERERYNLQLKRTADLRRIDATLMAVVTDMAPGDKVQALASLADAYNKLMAASRRMMPETDKLAVAMDVLKRFGEHIAKRKPGLAHEFVEQIEEFAATLAAAYK